MRVRSRISSGKKRPAGNSMDLTQHRRGGRVLFVTSNYPRWAGDTTTPFVHDLAVDLGARGWQVRVLAPHAPGAARDETIDGVHVHRFRYLVLASAQTVCYGGGALVNIRNSRLTRAKIPVPFSPRGWPLLGRSWGELTLSMLTGC
jgi:hypothetical protein